MFTKRTTAPTNNNKYYRHKSAGGLNECILIRDGMAIPNCVGYAWGRSYEISGKRPTLSTGNAENWFLFNDGYVRKAAGPEAKPKLGAIVCWRKGKAGNSSDGYGHVAVVEDYDATYVYCSEMGYFSKAFKYRKIKRSTMYLGTGYTFQGYIYPDGCVDKVRNPYTKPTYIVNRYRHEYGKIKTGNAGVKWVQYQLQVLGLYSGKVDGFFGPKTEQAVKTFQRNNRDNNGVALSVDGSVGPLTREALARC